MPEGDLIFWNSIITAFAGNGKVFEALEFLNKMEISSSGNLKPNVISWTAVSEVSHMANKMKNYCPYFFSFRIPESNPMPRP